jgi:hypothetical protein
MPLALLLLLAVALALAVVTVVIARRGGRWPTLLMRPRRPRKLIWMPTVQHRELPPPKDDPAVAWARPQADAWKPGRPPLADQPLNPGLRTQLDGYALGRAKRVLEAPDLLQHAAADVESWPLVEQAVNETLALAESKGTVFADRALLTRALALCAAQGVLIAEWRQLEDGATAWNGEVAQVRASDAFTIQRVAEAMLRRLLPDLFAGIQRRPPDLEPGLLVSYCTAVAFYLRLHGNPPSAFRREVAVAG